MIIRRHRDIQLIEKDSKTYLAIACDVSASIGPKVNDLIQVSGETAGYYATTVPIIELIAIGAKPISVTDTLGVEMQGVGAAVIAGVHKAMLEGEINPLCLTGSTEDNIPTTTTTVGITVIAELNKDLLETYTPKVGEQVYVIGLPKMGTKFLDEEIRAKKGEVMTIETAMQVRYQGSIGHMLPVGSKGIGHELELLLELYQLDLKWAGDVPIDLEASAGPASCMIVTCKDEGAQFLKSKVKQPMTFLGEIKKR